MVRKREIASHKKSKKTSAVRTKPPQETIKIWLDSDVLERFQSTGPGWQRRINRVLKHAKVG